MGKFCESCGKKFPWVGFIWVCPYCESEHHTHCGNNMPRWTVSELRTAMPHKKDVTEKLMKNLRDNRTATETGNLLYCGSDGGYDTNDPLEQQQIRVCPKCDKNVRAGLRKEIERLIVCQRFEDAALAYEKLGEFEMAGETRAEGRMTSQTVKHISLDLTGLINRIATTGLVLPYKCPSCGASMKIDKDSNPDNLKVCAYCGSTFDAETLTKFLKNILD